MIMKKIWLMICIISTLFLISCTPVQKECEIDGDCVQATCCHPTDVVNTENAPNCNGIICTMECKPGTLDCGQGEVRCIDNKCKAILG
jgi:hypothetical protein